MQTAQITKQLAIFIENRPGTLARVCAAVSEAGINIYAISMSDTVDHSVVRVVVSDPAKALFVFEEHGAMVLEDEVVMIETDNKMGALAQISDTMAKSKVNIEYAYSATLPQAKKVLIILRVSDVKKALKALNA